MSARYGFPSGTVIFHGELLMRSGRKLDRVRRPAPGSRLLRHGGRRPYAGCAIRLNGRELHRDDREPDWAKGGPMYRPDSVELPLKAGENLLEFIVRANSVNWELFFDCAADVAA